ncbi:alkylglycerol monooxygenase-like [Ostrea edulis]|uniref:alkylglycerol monooxygenase-like n=1 Tax=Ostrea edulis TaxID=37623 RepID=UPI0024AF2406|nr:alkylglycerol monooxygenase-like [Ostrea edulis]
MSNLAKVPFLTGVRRLFYLVSVNESSFKDVEEVPLYINEATPFFFVCIFLEMAVMWFKKDKKGRMNDGATSVSAGQYSRFPMLLGLRSITITGYVWVYDNYNIYGLPWDSAWTWWFCFLGMDLGYYWFHRMAHEVNFMWAAHQVHHSSEYYNLTTALRQSVLQIYTSWVFYLPLALFIPPSIFMVHNELNILYQFWIHTQFIKSLGPLEYILNTPSHHRVHHGRNPYCIDKNYAGTLIIWDRLFGTFQAEDEEVVYGLTHPINTFDPNVIQFGYLKYMIERFGEMKGWKNKLRVVFCGPGWAPGKPRTGDINDIPVVKAPWPKYHLNLPSWVSVYAAVHFTLELLYYQEVAARNAGLSQLSILLFVLHIGFGLTCFGKIFDNDPSAPQYELLRCFLTLAGDVALCYYGFYGAPGYRPTFVIFLQAVFMFSLCVWSSVIYNTTMKTKKVD